MITQCSHRPIFVAVERGISAQSTFALAEHDFQEGVFDFVGVLSAVGV